MIEPHLETQLVSLEGESHLERVTGLIWSSGERMTRDIRHRFRDGSVTSSDHVAVSFLISRLHLYGHPIQFWQVLTNGLWLVVADA